MTDALGTFRSPAPPTGEPPLPFDIVVFELREGLEPADVDPDDAEAYVERTETFHARPFVSGGLLAQIERMTNRNPGENARAGDAIYDFYDGALVPRDVKRFRDLIESPRVYVHGSVLSDLAVKLYERYSDRPTSQP